MSPKTAISSNALNDVSFGAATGSSALDTMEAPRNGGGVGKFVSGLRAFVTAGVAATSIAPAMAQTLFLDHGLNSDGKTGFGSVSSGGQRIANLFTIPTLTETENLFSYSITGGARRGNGSYSGASDIFNISAFTMEVFIESNGTFSENTPDYSATSSTILGRENVAGLADDGGAYFILTFENESSALNSILRNNTGKRALVTLTGESGGDFNFLTYTSNVSLPDPLRSWVNDNSISLPWGSFSDYNVNEMSSGRFQATDPVPEPAGIAALGLGLAALAARRRKTESK